MSRSCGNVDEYHFGHEEFEELMGRHWGEGGQRECDKGI